MATQKVILPASGFSPLSMLQLGATTYQIDKGNAVTVNTTTDELGRLLGLGAIIAPLSGTTAARPVSTVIGHRYFDTTLGKPVFWSGTQWVDSTGTAA